MTQQTVSPRPTRGRQLDLRIYALLLLRWWWLILLAGIVAAATAYITSSQLTPIYEATSKVLINQARSPSGSDYTDILTSERIARTYADLSSTLSIYAANASVSAIRLRSALGICMTSASVGDIQKIVTGQRCWRTKARVSANVGTSFTYQAAWRAGMCWP